MNFYYFLFFGKVIKISNINEILFDMRKRLISKYIL